jgi:hypothetical protein
MKRFLIAVLVASAVAIPAGNALTPAQSAAVAAKARADALARAKADAALKAKVAAQTRARAAAVAKAKTESKVKLNVRAETKARVAAAAAAATTNAALNRGHPSGTFHAARLGQVHAPRAGAVLGRGINTARAGTGVHAAVGKPGQFRAGKAAPSHAGAPSRGPAKAAAARGRGR